VRGGQALEQRDEARQRVGVGNALLVRLLDGQQAYGEAGLLFEVVAAARWRGVGGARVRG
jgi:hypothetical protein